MIRRLSVFLLLASLAGAQAPEATIAKILEESRERGQVMDHLDHITNRIGPRLTSSENLTIAMEWATERLKSYGLEARMEQWGTMPVGFNRGPWFGRIVAPADSARSLEFGTDAWSAGTHGRQKGLAIVGESSAEDVAGRAADFAGKWVVLTGGGRRGSVSRAVREAYENASVLGLIVSTGDERIWTQGNPQVSFDALPKLISINMKKSDHEALVDLLKADKAVELEFDIRNHFKQGPIPLYNVIAELKGTEKPDELVIIGGHLDSWDGATGTTDNGTGASTTIEAARLLAKSGARPKRTIRFMLFSGEEQGLLGSRGFVQKHPEEMDKTSAVLVHDGGTNYASGIQATPAMEPIFREVLKPLMSLSEEMPFEVVPTSGFSRMGASDHASWLQQGVPGFFWRQSGKAVYGYGWHTQNDTFDLAVPEYQRHTAEVAAITALAIANLDDLLPRDGLLRGGEPGRQIGRSSGNGDNANRRLLGVTIAEGDGVVIDNVTEGSVAAKAGIKSKDRIVSIGDAEINGIGELRRALSGGENKKTAVILRDGKKVTVELDWTAR